MQHHLSGEDYEMHLIGIRPTKEPTMRFHILTTFLSIESEITTSAGHCKSPYIDAMSSFLGNHTLIDIVWTQLLPIKCFVSVQTT